MSDNNNNNNNNSKDKSMNYNLFISGLSGGTAGVVVDFIYYPLETIKTRI
jgi:hypothetical protein